MIVLCLGFSGKAKADELRTPNKKQKQINHEITEIHEQKQDEPRNTRNTRTKTPIVFVKSNKYSVN
jgi:hypothetical protein